MTRLPKSLVLVTVMTEPQRSVPMANPGQPHPFLQASTQSLNPWFLRAQAGPASTLVRKESRRGREKRKYTRRFIVRSSKDGMIQLMNVIEKERRMEGRGGRSGGVETTQTAARCVGLEKVLEKELTAAGPLRLLYEDH